MTTSSSCRTPLQKLQAHSLWLSLACLNLAYTPLSIPLLLPRHDREDYMTGILALSAAAVAWVFSLGLLGAVAGHHNKLRRRAREAATVASPGQRKHFRGWLELACVNLLAGPAFIALAVYHSQGLGIIAITGVFVMLSNSPASLTWLLAAKQDAKLIKRVTAR